MFGSQAEREHQVEAWVCLMPIRNALGKVKTQQKSQNKIPACMWSLTSKGSLAIQAREGVWQLCSLSCGM